MSSQQPPWRDRRGRGRGRLEERGVVAGLEGVMFGVLVLVVGAVVVVNAWAVLQARRTLDGAAREYLRAYTESDDPAGAAAAGRDALDSVLLGESRRGPRTPVVRVEGPDPNRFGPCEEATVRLSTVVPAARLPFIGAFGSTTVVVTHTDLVDPHREIRVGPGYDAEATPCGR